MPDLDGRKSAITPGSRVDKDCTGIERLARWAHEGCEELTSDVLELRAQPRPFERA